MFDQVLLIEAGGDEPIPSSVPAWVTAYWGREDTDWDYHTEPQEKACLNNGGVCSWPRGKMLGTLHLSLSKLIQISFSPSSTISSFSIR